MLDLEDLEARAPTNTASLRVDGQVFRMQLPRALLTPREVAEIWEQEWGVHYATRLRFWADVPDEPGVGPRRAASSAGWLNPRSDSLPLAPAVVRLEGLGSILCALAVELRRRERHGPGAPAQDGPRPLAPCGAPGERAAALGAAGPQGERCAQARRSGLGPVGRQAFRRFQGGSAAPPVLPWQERRRLADAEDPGQVVPRRREEELRRRPRAARPPRRGRRRAAVSAPMGTWRPPWRGPPRGVACSRMRVCTIIAQRGAR
ncbi:unnamed protein product [Prorocentrum cordatum]|uniref:Uncharacterized protein n=1 Tax=Prorocentrum cordatum TaxID=2364126 RepID=A0ABN9XHL5_9DINO|nr:unnamed protein product [Polarella glacialis]